MPDRTGFRIVVPFLVLVTLTGFFGASCASDGSGPQRTPGDPGLGEPRAPGTDVTAAARPPASVESAPEGATRSAYGGATGANAAGATAETRGTSGGSAPTSAVPGARAEGDIGPTPAPEQGTAPADPESLGAEGTTWQVVAYAGADGRLVRPPVGPALTLRLAEGRMSGDAGCNSFGGAYTLDGIALALTVDAVTQAMCDDATMVVERAYLAALGQVVTHLEVGPQLQLTDLRGEAVLVLRPVGDLSAPGGPQG